MSLRKEDVSAAMIEGYTFVCATCKHLHEARSRGLTRCMVAHAGDSCAGPFAAGSYPRYDGVVPRNQLHSVCFVCGDTPEAAIEIPENGRPVLVGICGVHLPLLDSMSPGDSRPPFITRVHVPVLEA